MYQIYCTTQVRKIKLDLGMKECDCEAKGNTLSVVTWDANLKSWHARVAESCE